MLSFINSNFPGCYFCGDDLCNFRFQFWGQTSKNPLQTIPSVLLLQSMKPATHRRRSAVSARQTPPLAPIGSAAPLAQQRVNRKSPFGQPQHVTKRHGRIACWSLFMLHLFLINCLKTLLIIFYVVVNYSSTASTISICTGPCIKPLVMYIVYSPFKAHCYCVHLLYWATAWPKFHWDQYNIYPSTAFNIGTHLNVCNQYLSILIEHKLFYM